MQTCPCQHPGATHCPTDLQAAFGHPPCSLFGASGKLSHVVPAARLAASRVLQPEAQAGRPAEPAEAWPWLAPPASHQGTPPPLVWTNTPRARKRAAISPRITQPGVALLGAAAADAGGRDRGSLPTDTGFGVQKGSQASSGCRASPGPATRPPLTQAGRGGPGGGTWCQLLPCTGTRGRAAGISQRFRVGSLASPAMGPFSKRKPRPGLTQRLAQELETSMARPRHLESAGRRSLALTTLAPKERGERLPAGAGGQEGSLHQRLSL